MVVARILAVGCFFVAAGCEAGGAPRQRAEPAREEPRAVPSAASPEKKLYGSALSSTAATDLAEVLKDPERFSGKRLVLNGHVRSNCTRKGCWMELAPSKDPSTPACRVTFHGYGFFVPKDSAGSDARVEGELKVVRVSAAHAAHLEEEGGRVADKAADGTAREVHLVASGVELFRRGG
ncbi:MAG TPA: DUF4920 domain-containing protein [Polyangiaceae bacterium]